MFYAHKTNEPDKMMMMMMVMMMIVLPLNATLARYVLSPLFLSVCPSVRLSSADPHSKVRTKISRRFSFTIAHQFVGPFALSARCSHYNVAVMRTKAPLGTGCETFLTSLASLIINVLSVHVQAVCTPPFVSHLTSLPIDYSMSALSIYSILKPHNVF